MFVLFLLVVMGEGGDGLFMMEEIFGFKLDVDWVIFLVCNIGVGVGVGVEVVFGLGCVFFYVGMWVLLVMNWLVYF